MKPSLTRKNRSEPTRLNGRSRPANREKRRSYFSLKPPKSRRNLWPKVVIIAANLDNLDNPGH